MESGGGGAGDLAAAHRIGQRREVFACRIIARDTIEEKVLAAGAVRAAAARAPSPYLLNFHSAAFVPMPKPTIRPSGVHAV